MSPITINFAMAVTMLRSIVERFGFDHTPGDDGSEGCIYFTRTGLRLTPVCIVGQFAADLGILRALATDTDQFGSCRFGVGYEGEAIRNSFSSYGVDFTEDAFALLQAAQVMQDTGSPVRGEFPLGYTGNVSKSWGDAVEYGIWCVQQTALNEFKDNHPAFNV